MIVAAALTKSFGNAPLPVLEGGKLYDAIEENAADRERVAVAVEF